MLYGIQVLFQAVYSLLADMMFYLAGILKCGLFRNADFHEQGAEKLMSFVDGLGDLLTGLRKMYMVVIIPCDETVRFELLESDAHARLGKSEIVDDVYSPHGPFFFASI